MLGAAVPPRDQYRGGRRAIKNDPLCLSGGCLNDGLELFLDFSTLTGSNDIAQDTASETSPCGEALLGVEVEDPDDKSSLDHFTGKVCSDGRFPNSPLLLNDRDNSHESWSTGFRKAPEKRFSSSCLLPSTFSENRKSPALPLWQSERHDCG